MGEEDDLDSEHDSEKPSSSEGEAFPVSIFRHLGYETIVGWWQLAMPWFHQHFMAPWNLLMAFSSIINPT